VKDGSKAARQEPTPKGYHTGLRAAERVPAATGCALSRKGCGMRLGFIEGPEKQLRLKKVYGNELRWGTPAYWFWSIWLMSAFASSRPFCKSAVVLTVSSSAPIRTKVSAIPNEMPARMTCAPRRRTASTVRSKPSAVSGSIFGTPVKSITTALARCVGCHLAVGCAIASRAARPPGRSAAQRAVLPAPAGPA